jgi:hypothetical protein
MKLYDEVVDKFGDLAIDLGKTAVIAGFAGLFVEKIIPSIISIGTLVVGLILIFWGLLAFHFKNRRREKTEKKEEQVERNEDKNV